MQVQSALDSWDGRILVTHSSGMVNLKQFPVSNLVGVFINDGVKRKKSV